MTGIDGDPHSSDGSLSQPTSIVADLLLRHHIITPGQESLQYINARRTAFNCRSDFLTVLHPQPRYNHVRVYSHRNEKGFIQYDIALLQEILCRN